MLIPPSPPNYPTMSAYSSLCKSIHISHNKPIGHTHSQCSQICKCWKPEEKKKEKRKKRVMIVFCRQRSNNQKELLNYFLTGRRINIYLAPADARHITAAPFFKASRRGICTSNLWKKTPETEYWRGCRGGWGACLSLLYLLNSVNLSTTKE